ncbi:YdeI/OmpD-associated family protein [Amycolatopsis solani]|uniref:YdeI/OmpD-associated family protein n=1 Tax=Amycolatopsis solani TaxID=3028615 RepID=UPI0025B04413|nr:YdeI/OmpD-associated family protein [Amycolatopsis sp. MEP2-6]
MTEVPGELAAALAADPDAAAAFEALPPSHRREYAQWVAEAKKPETRVSRAGKTVARLREPG